MYFFLLTNHSNYTAFDEALALRDQLKKSNSENRKSSNILEVDLSNKATTRQNDCSPYRCFVLFFLPLALVGLEPLQH